MKHHNKVYEDVFSTDQPKLNLKLNLEKITVGDMTLDNYISVFRNFLNDSFTRLFDDSVRLAWLRRKFTYYGQKTKLPMNKNSWALNNAFVKLLRRNVGKDIQIITRSKYFSKLELYFDEFFPGFDEGDPFGNPDYYKFPFKYISIDYLMAVYQLDFRMDLLKKADEQKMTYAVFLDYIINHVSVENDELGRNRYEVRQNRDRNFPFCIRDTDKDLQTKKGRKIK